MNANIQGLYRHLAIHKNQSGCIEHKGAELTRNQALSVLEFGLKNERETIADITDEEVESILKGNKRIIRRVY